jgi:hypothetical protein
MALESHPTVMDCQQLARTAQRLEQLAQFACRPDVRMHLFERAAECLAKAALERARRQEAE